MIHWDQYYKVNPCLLTMSIIFSMYFRLFIIVRKFFNFDFPKVLIVHNFQLKVSKILKIPTQNFCCSFNFQKKKTKKSEDHFKQSFLTS